MSSPFTSGGQPGPAAATMTLPAAQPSLPRPAAPVLEGRVIGQFNTTDPLCGEHFPAGPELTRLAMAARGGRPTAFVGSGHEHTPLICSHSPGGRPWRLGDHLVHLSAMCARGDHPQCRDKACLCECQGAEASGAIDQAAADSKLAAALDRLADSLTSPSVTADAAVPGDVEELRAAVARLTAERDAALAARPAAVRRTRKTAGD